MPGFANMLTDGVTVGFTVIVIPVLVAVAGDAQVALLVSTQVTTLPLANAAFVYVVLFVPTFTPFSFHWYDGVVPPLVGVAVKVTEVPEQIVLPGFADILTAGTTVVLTVIVIPLLVAVIGDAHEALLVITQVTTSPLARAAFV